jgi:serine/threonine protein kinase
MDEAQGSRARRGTLAGEIVGGHELLHVIATGGMGEVYAARHVALGMLRAIKLIRSDMRGRESARERFAREAQVLAKLQHNSIVQIIEFGSLDNGWPFLAMEYIDGPNLEDCVAEGALSVADALAVLLQLALALQYAHSRGVIHRDLKPANVLLRSGDLRQVKIIDFGLARLLDDATKKRLTADGEVFGSPLYMAPEQVDGDPHVTGAVDVYALGGIAYTMLAGIPPFGHRPSMLLMTAHKLETPPRLGHLCPAIPEALDSLLFACLAKEPAQRPAAADLAAQLGRLAGHGVSSPRRTPPRGIEVAAPWQGRQAAYDVAVELLESTPPPTASGLALATKIMALIGQVVAHLSSSDPELTSLLRLEARIREQLANVERERGAIVAQIDAGVHTPAALVKHRDELTEQARTLHAQQMPLQRRMIEVAERHRR